VIWTCTAQFFGITGPPLPSPSTLCVEQEEYCHDTAVANFWAADVDADSFVSGMPVTLDFGFVNVRRYFYGYVNHAERVNNVLSTTQGLTNRNSVNVYCVGASWPMKQVGTRGWFNRTASQVVTEIAQAFGFDIDVVPDQTVWPSLQMAGQTYWQFCVHLAKMIGYTFYCNGVQLVFRPRKINPRALTGTVAAYDYRADPAGMPVFTPVLGATSPGGGRLANRQATGIDPRTTTVIYSQVPGSPAPSIMGLSAENPVFNKINHFAARNQQELNAQNAGEGAVNQLYVTAEAHAAGNPAIAQGSVVQIVNANGSQNGLWYVTKACHSLEVQQYAVDMCLGRDSLGTAPAVRIVPQITNPAQPMLIQMQWQAA
jgi:phage protein D